MATGTGALLGLLLAFLLGSSGTSAEARNSECFAPWQVRGGGVEGPGLPRAKPLPAPGPCSEDAAALGLVATPGPVPLSARAPEPQSPRTFSHGSFQIPEANGATTCQLLHLLGSLARPPPASSPSPFVRLGQQGIQDGAAQRLFGLAISFSFTGSAAQQAVAILVGQCFMDAEGREELQATWMQCEAVESMKEDWGTTSPLAESPGWTFLLREELRSKERRGKRSRGLPGRRSSQAKRLPPLHHKPRSPAAESPSVALRPPLDAKLPQGGAGSVEWRPRLRPLEPRPTASRASCVRRASMEAEPTEAAASLPPAVSWQAAAAEEAEDEAAPSSTSPTAREVEEELILPASTSPGSGEETVPPTSSSLEGEAEDDRPEASSSEWPEPRSASPSEPSSAPPDSSPFTFSSSSPLSWKAPSDGLQRRLDEAEGRAEQPERAIVKRKSPPAKKAAPKYTVRTITPAEKEELVSVAKAMHRERFARNVKELFHLEKEAALKSPRGAAARPLPAARGVGKGGRQLHGACSGPSGAL
ncbi:uncharacterized protein [Erythrolamprus reginae]|uniref:uncharacterized protein n=1 Tax=Erythrolamprus reginae TaxID=121349 RepID=UPI00396C43E0